MPKRTPEQEAARKVRQARDHAAPKCRCGNVIGLVRQEDGKDTCFRCGEIDHKASTRTETRDRVMMDIYAVEDDKLRSILKDLFYLSTGEEL